MLRRRTVQLAAVTAVVVGSVVPATAAVASPAASPQVPTPAGAAAALGVTGTPDGWIHFSHTLEPYLAHKKTSVIKGTVGADGQCVFASTSAAAPLGSSGYSEETGFNPAACKESVVSGTLTQAGQAELAAQAAAAPSATGAQTNAESASTAGAAPTATHPKSTTAAPAVTAAAAGTWAAFEKVSYVDPLDITITSVTDNLTWSGNGIGASSGGVITGGSAYAVPYKFAYDNWSSSGVSFAWRGCIGCSYLTSQAYDTFYNTDFELVVVALTGVSGYAACGFDSRPATFYLAPWTEGFPNGYYSWGHSNSVSGGCSDLVHFRENHGGGHSS